MKTRLFCSEAEYGMITQDKLYKRYQHLFPAIHGASALPLVLTGQIDNVWFHALKYSNQAYQILFIIIIRREVVST
jgi:hypothetical protein